MARLGLELGSYNTKPYGLSMMQHKLAITGPILELWRSEFSYRNILINLSHKVGPQLMHREDWAINGAPSNRFEQFLLQWTNEPALYFWETSHLVK